MCQAYPNCSHQGKVIKRQEKLHRHCETTLQNTTCPYLRLGCLGCTFKIRDYTQYNLSQFMSIKGLNLP